MTDCVIYNPIWENNHHPSNWPTKQATNTKSLFKHRTSFTVNHRNHHCLFPITFISVLSEIFKILCRNWSGMKSARHSNGGKRDLEAIVVVNVGWFNWTKWWWSVMLVKWWSGNCWFWWWSVVFGYLGVCSSTNTWGFGNVKRFLCDVAEREREW